MRTTLTLLTALLLTTLVPVSAQEDTLMPAFSYTYNHPTGNRYLPGAAGTFPEVTDADIALDGVPRWVLGVPGEAGVGWVVVLDNGRVQFVQATPGADPADALTIPLDTLSSGEVPPLVRYGDTDLPAVVVRAGEDIAAYTHPVPVDPLGETLAYVAANGDLVLWRGGDELDRAALGIQPDARLVLSDSGLLALYTNATTDRYVHGIMGDELEGYQLHVFDPSGGSLSKVAQVGLPGDDVFEGLSPFWADVNGDGVQDLVTTVSNGLVGAWIRVYSAEGEMLAESEPIGQGFRWRHQIAAGPFGIEGESQIFDVQTPHIGGLATFLALDGGRLVMNNAQLQYTTHPINARNLDMAVVADFNGNGQPEVVVLSQARTDVIALENTLAGVVEVWRFPLNGSLTSNLAAVMLADGTLALAAGTDAGVLHIWQ